MSAEMSGAAPSGRGPRSEERYNIRAIERAILTLGCFSVEEPELSLGEIASKTSIPKPTVFRILSTLERHRYVESDRPTTKYRLGSEILALGGVALSSLSLRKAAGPQLDRLHWPDTDSLRCRLAAQSPLRHAGCHPHGQPR